VVNILFKNTYKKDSRAVENPEKLLKPWNNLLIKLSGYIDKYNEPFLGYVRNKSDIAALENKIEDLTTVGKTDPSYTFIRTKILFKTTKLQELNLAIDELTQIESKTLSKEHWHFFKSSSAKDLESPSNLLNERKWLEHEIQRQEEKRESLMSCLPDPEIAKLNLG
jgi:hypothetical protein